MGPAPDQKSLLIERIRATLSKVRGTEDVELNRDLTVADVRQLIRDVRALFKIVMKEAGVDDEAIRQMMTKFQDAGRRSPPWQAGSLTGHRRPQTGAEGNRQRRWLFDPNHKFYADEIVATMTEVKFYLQTLSMDGAPALPNQALRNESTILLGHLLQPGQFKDPITKEPARFQDFVTDRRAVESGHIVPLGRTVGGQRGRHSVPNSTLMLRDSNRIQADKTIPELMEMFERILKRAGYTVTPPR